jgi:hypothetical protein
VSSLQPPVVRAGRVGGSPPALPNRPAAGRGRLIGYLAGLLVLGLVIFAWFNVQASITELINGFFAKKGLIRDLVAVLPGVRNTLLALTMYRVDANFRSAVTLGAVGGGGIGFLIENDLNVFQLKAVLTFILVLVVFVLAIERVSSIVRIRLAS